MNFLRFGLTGYSFHCIRLEICLSDGFGNTPPTMTWNTWSTQMDADDNILLRNTKYANEQLVKLAFMKFVWGYLLGLSIK
jgi:hypothetical protein